MTRTDPSAALPSPTISHKWVVGITCLLGTFMEVLDTSVANVALASIQGSFAAGTDEVTWVITSYLVANAIIMPITGWLQLFVGQKRLYLTCLAVFTLASLASGAATSLPMLIFMRIIQGVAGGAMVPLSQAITLDAFPEEEHGYAAALFGIGAICGPVLGPLLGGWITDNWSWPWIFYINIPVGILAFTLATVFVREPAYLKKPGGRVDYSSLIYIALGLGCLEVFLSRGERYDWFASPFIQLVAGLSLLGIVLFIWRSLTARNPLVDLRIFRLPEFAGGMFLIFVASSAMYGTFLCVPLFVQHLLRYTPTWAGVILAPCGVATMVAMGLAGYLVGKVHVRGIVGTGFACLAAALYLLTRISLRVDVPYLTRALVVFGFGMGFILVPIATETIRRIPRELLGTSSSMFNLMRNEGGSVGIALCTTILTQRVQFHHARLAEHITPLSASLQNTAATLTRGFDPAVIKDPITMARLALGVVDKVVTREATLMSFIDVFAFLAALMAASLPVVMLMKHFKSNGRTGAIVH